MRIFRIFYKYLGAEVSLKMPVDSLYFISVIITKSCTRQASTPISKFLSGKKPVFLPFKNGHYIRTHHFSQIVARIITINRTGAVKSEMWSNIDGDDLVKQIVSFFFRYRLAKYGHHTWKRRVSIVAHIGEIFCGFGGVKEPFREYHSPW